MKKILMILACCVALCGCGGEEGPSSEPQVDSAPREESQENQYDTEELVSITVEDVEYSIPKSWSENSKNSGFNTYYYSDGMFVMVQAVDLGEELSYDNLSEEEKNDEKNKILDNISSGDEIKSYKEISSEIQSIQGTTSFRYKADVEYENAKGYQDSVLFVHGKVNYNFVIIVYSNSKKDYKEEFESLLESISFIKEESLNIDAFSETKKSIIDRTRELTLSEEQTKNMMNIFEESYFKILKLEKWPTDDMHSVSEFSTSISYFYVNFESGSKGNQIGEIGWSALESLWNGDEDFQEKMSQLKEVYEDAGFSLYETKYDSGQYKVGEDIEPGEYVFFADSSKGYFGVSSDANGNDIIANDNFSYNSIMTLQEGEYLKLSRCYAVPISDVEELPLAQATMFKIGLHLPSGEYKIIADDEKGYYCIYSDGRQKNIVSNDNFEGQSYITVSDGQYLTLSRCHIEQ